MTRPDLDALRVIERDGRAVAVLELGEVTPWFHRQHGYSMNHALEHEGYAVVNPEPWPADEARRYASTARNVLMGDSFHNSRGCVREGRLGRENCGPCCAFGYEPRGGFGDDYSVRRDGPNYAGWGRLYVEARLRVPSKFDAAFWAQLVDRNQDNAPYAAALLRSIRTFGVAIRGYSQLGKVDAPEAVEA